MSTPPKDPPDPTLSDDLTHLLVAWNRGDRDALETLMPMVCNDLRAMARRYMGGDNDRHELQPTALVNEFFVKIRGESKVQWQSRGHFFGFAAQTMRSILVDAARAKKRQKRGGDPSPMTLGTGLEAVAGVAASPEVEIIALHQILDRLEEIDPQAASVVKLRYFVGMTVAETAAALGVSTATVKRDWRFAQLWLFRALNES